MTDPNYPPPPGGGYGQMPADSTPAPGVPGQAPSTVKNAVLIMYFRAVLGVVGLIILLTTKDTLRARIQDRNPGYDSSKLDSVTNTAIAISAVVGVVLLILYVLLAIQVAKGKNWARIVTWVISALDVLSIFGVIGNAPAISKVASVVEALSAIAIIVLLAMSQSNQYFAKRTY